MTHTIAVRTSQSGWFAELAKAYKDSTPVLVTDDANVGINPETDSLYQMALTAKLSTGDVLGGCVACGMAASGVTCVLLAVFDPEPTSKLTLLVCGGLALIAMGGGSAIYIFTKKRPPGIKVSGSGFEITWA